MAMMWEKIRSVSTVDRVAEAMGEEPAGDSQELRELILSVQGEGGHGECSRRLYELYWPALVHYFKNRGMSLQDAEDIAQETMFRVCSHLQSFRFEASFKTWMFRIAANLLRNRWRDQSALKRKADVVSLEEMMGPETDKDGRAFEIQGPEASPYDNAVVAESAEALREAVHGMPPRMRAVFLMHGKGLSNREAASLLGVQVSTIKYQLKEARKRLRTVLPALTE